MFRRIGAGHGDNLSAYWMTLVRAADGRMVLGTALGVGLAVRAAVFWHTPDLGTEIVDEQHYAALASNVLAGHGFAWGPGQPTSIRPPLYPGLLAGIWSVAGAGNLQAVRLVQIVLALLTTGLVYQLGRRLFSPAVGRYAAAATFLYPSLIFFNFTILTETLYVFLLTGFILLAVVLIDRGRPATALACGLTLGLSCLTRSVLWPLPVVLCPLLLFLLPGPRHTRLALSALVFAGYALAVGPWAVRNTQVQGVVTIVDTMGGLNLHMGNYEHTPDDRLWDAISLTGEKHWAYPLQAEHSGGGLTEGQKDRWAQQRALSYIAAHPGTSLRRSAIKFADFWGIERELAGGFSQGIYQPPTWFAVTAAAAVALAFVLVALTGTAGLWLVGAREWRAHVLVLLPAVAIMAGHTITFGHSRYHLPLIPILALYGAAFGRDVLARSVPLAQPAVLRYGKLRLAASVTCVLGLLLIWSRQLLLVDSERISAFFANVR